MTELLNKELVIQKYGGSSLASPELIKQVADSIARAKARDISLVVVVSAMGSMTSDLVALARKTARVQPQRELDMLVTAGERVSMALLAMALHERSVPAISLTGSQCGIITDESHSSARILSVGGERIRIELNQNKVVIVAGFQGVSRKKEITTLGRGGSDTTAVALAAALGAKRCEICTDVDGLYTADPRVVSSARKIPHCSYELALEYASFGAKMHPRSIALAKRKNVPLVVKSSAETEEGAGTRVDIVGSHGEEGILGIGCRKDLVSGAILGNLREFFSWCDSYCVEVVSLWDEKGRKNFLADIPSFASLRDAPVRIVEPNLSFVAAVGPEARRNPKLLSLVRKTKACHVVVADLSVGVAVKESEGTPIARRWHEELFAHRGGEESAKIRGSRKAPGTFRDLEYGAGT